MGTDEPAGSLSPAPLVVARRRLALAAAASASAWSTSTAFGGRQDAAALTSTSERGLARYIRRKDTTNVEDYVKDILEVS